MLRIYHLIRIDNIFRMNYINRLTFVKSDVQDLVLFQHFTFVGEISGVVVEAAQGQPGRRMNKHGPSARDSSQWMEWNISLTLSRTAIPQGPDDFKPTWYLHPGSESRRLGRDY